MRTISNRYYQDSITNPNVAGTAKEKIEAALTTSGSHPKSGKWTCPVCGRLALVLYPMRDHQGTYPKCHAGCGETIILAAVGLTPADKYDNQWTWSTPVRDAVTILRKTPVQWFTGPWMRNEHILYDACLTKAWMLDSLEFSYPRRVAATETGLSQWVTGRTFLELCMLGLITPTGSRTDKGHGKSYRLVTDYQGPRLADDIPQGVNNQPYKNISAKPLPPLTGYFNVWLFFDPRVDPSPNTRAWLRATGLAVVKVMSHTRAMGIAEIVRESGVSKNTVKKILRTKLRRNGLAVETDDGWKLTGDIARFDPDVDIVGKREEVYRRERESYAAKRYNGVGGNTL